MIWAFLGIVLGVLLGLALELNIPLEYTRYTAVTIIGVLDALFGAIRAELTHDQYNGIIFISGLIFNVILAIGITFLGDKLGLDLYLAATVVFTFRIFSNMGISRRVIIDSLVKNKKHKTKN